VRWERTGGTTRWRNAALDVGAPDPAERAAARPGTEPLWVPHGARRVDIRVSARTSLSDVRLVAVGDPARSFMDRLRGVLGRSTASAQAASGEDLLGPVHTRADWGADESMRRCSPTYAAGVRAVVVHHTDQPNDYARSDVPALIRADYAYHVQARGWCDIGYNLLVDRFGGIWEGRYGGVDRAVVGAHAEGFNSGTLGVAYLGETDDVAPPAAARAALARVAAYAGRHWDFDPAGHVRLTSGGSPRYGAGRSVRLPRVMGHRDVGLTDCPGRLLYADLPAVRRSAAALVGGLRFTSVAVTGDPVHAPNPLRISLRMSRRGAWSVVVRDGGGDALARSRGHGRHAALSWDGTEVVGALPVPVTPQRLTWRATARRSGVAAHAHGTVTVGVPLVG
jgi:hypothetical protein